MGQSLSFKQILLYLNVDLSSQEQTLLVSKLENAAKGNKKGFERFSNEKIQLFLNEHYPQLWKSNYKKSDAYQNLLQQEIDRRVDFAKQEGKDIDLDEIEQLSHAKLLHVVEQKYNQHLTDLDNHHAEAEKSFNESMVTYEANRLAMSVEAFLAQEFQRYQRLALTLEKLGNAIATIEKDSFKKSNLQLDASTPDYQRWAAMLVNAEDEKLDQDMKDLNIGIKRGERAERLETWAQNIGLVLKFLSISLALASMSHHFASEVTEEIVEESIEEVSLTVETTSLLTVGVIFWLKGDSKLGWVYIGIGIANLITEIITSIADFGGTHFMSTTTSASVIAFVGSACSFALAYLNQQQIDESQKRLVNINSELGLIDKELQTAAKAKQEKQKLVQGKNENLLVRRELERKLQKRVDFEISHVNKTLLLESLIEKKQRLEPSLEKQKEKINKIETSLKKLRNQKSLLESESKSDTEQTFSLLEQINHIDSVIASKLEHLEIEQQQSIKINQQYQKIISKYQKTKLDLAVLEQSEAANFVASDEIKQKLDALNSKFTGYLKREREIEHRITNSQTNDKELVAQRSALIEVSFFEKAQIKDKRISRNINIANGVILIAAGITSIVMGSIASAGTLPIIMISLSALSLGLALLRRFTFGSSPYSEKLKEQKQELMQYGKVIEHRLEIQNNLNIDDQQFNELQITLHDMIINKPGHAKQILEKISALSAANLSVEEISSARKALSTELEAFQLKQITNLLNPTNEHEQNGQYVFTTGL